MREFHAKILALDRPPDNRGIYVDGFMLFVKTEEGGGELYWLISKPSVVGPLSLALRLCMV